MNHSFKFKFLKKLITPIMLILLWNMGWGYELIENPKITHREEGVHCSKLVLVKQIIADFDTNLFFAHPTALTVDDEKSLYVYDAMLKKVFKFNNAFQYETSFLREGRGPAEIASGDIGIYKIAFAPNGNINICDTLNKKLIVFSKKGKHVIDIRLERDPQYPYYPVMDTQLNLYAISVNGGVVDKINVNNKTEFTFLDKKLNERFVVHMPKLDKRAERWGLLRPTLDDTYYDVINGQDLIIYMARPSTVFLFKNKKLITQFDIFLVSAMEKIRKKVANLPKKADKRTLFPGFWGTMFESFFVDKDDERYFYLQKDKDGLQILLYKFSIKGELIAIISSAPPIRGCVTLKKNGLFYGFNESEARIFYLKEEE